MPECLSKHFAQRYSPPPELQRSICTKLRSAGQARRAADTRTCWFILLGDVVFTGLMVLVVWLFAGSGLLPALVAAYGLVSALGCAAITFARQMQSRQGFPPGMYSLTF